MYFISCWLTCKNSVHKCIIFIWDMGLYNEWIITAKAKMAKCFCTYISSHNMLFVNILNKVSLQIITIIGLNLSIIFKVHLLCFINLSQTHSLRCMIKRIIIYCHRIFLYIGWRYVWSCFITVIVMKHFDRFVKFEHSENKINDQQCQCWYYPGKNEECRHIFRNCR